MKIPDPSSPFVLVDDIKNFDMRQQIAKDDPLAMKPGEAIVLERVGNGWLARPFNLGNRTANGLGLFQVFNDLGVAVATGGKESLCTFVEQHFRVHAQGDEA